MKRLILIGFVLILLSSFVSADGNFTHGLTLSSTFSGYSGDSGMIIRVLYPCILDSVYYATGVDTNKSYLYKSDDLGTLLASANIINSKAYYNYSLLPNTDYSIYSDKEGSIYTIKYLTGSTMPKWTGQVYWKTNWDESYRYEQIQSIYLKNYNLTFNVTNIKDNSTNINYTVNVTGHINEEFTLKDKAGNNDLTNNGAIWNAGIYEFDDNTDYLSYEETINLSLGFSYVIWINPIEKINNQRIVQRQNGGSSSSWGLWWYNGLRFSTADFSDGDLYAPTGDFPLNQWTMVTAIYNLTHKLIYANNVLSASEPSTGILRDDDLTTYIGNYISTPTFGFNGSFDDIQIFNRALTQSEITALYNGEEVTNGLISKYDFNSIGTKTYTGEGQYTTDILLNQSYLSDKSEGSNDLTNNGATWNETNEWVEFDGTNYIIGDYINVSNEFTIGYWFKGDGSDTQVTIRNGNSGTSGSTTTFDSYVTTTYIAFRSTYAGGGTPQQLTYNCDVTEWHHVLATNNGTEFNLYVDGINRDSDPVTGIYEANSGEALFLGINGDLVSNPFIGELDDIQIFNRVLNQTEITALYNNESIERGLIAKYDFATPTYDLDFYNTTQNGRPFFNQNYSNQNFTPSNYIFNTYLIPYSKIIVMNATTNTTLTDFTVTFNNTNYSDTSGIVYIPSYNDEITINISKTNFNIREIIYNSYNDIEKVLIPIFNYTFNIYSQTESLITSYLTNYNTNTEYSGSSIQIPMIDLFPEYSSPINITFEIEPQSIYYLIDNHTIEINYSESDYNITLEQYKLVLNFTDNVSGYYYDESGTLLSSLTEWIGLYNRDKFYFINDTLEKNMLDFPESTVTIRFGSNSSYEQYYEFENDGITNYYENILVINDTNDDLFIQAYADNSPLKDTVVRLYQLIENESAMLVSQKITDGNGNTFFRVNNEEDYYIVYYKTDYTVQQTRVFTPKDTEYTDSTTPLTLRLTKSYTSYAFGRIIDRGNNYPIFNNKSTSFNITVYTKLDESLYYTVNGGSQIRLPQQTGTYRQLYYHYKSITSTTDWGDTVTIRIYDSNSNLLFTVAYTYYEGTELIEVSDSILNSTFFMFILFIALILLSSVFGYIFEIEHIGTDVFIIGLIVLGAINFTLFALPASLAIFYYIINKFKGVVAND